MLERDKNGEGESVTGGWLAGALEVSVVRSRYHRLESVTVPRSTDLGPSATTHRHGMPVTTPARTLVDLGAILAERVVELGLESARVPSGW